MFSSEFYGIFKSTFFTKHIRATGSDHNSKYFGLWFFDVSSTVIGFNDKVSNIWYSILQKVNSLMTNFLKPISSLCWVTIFNNLGVPTGLMTCQFTSGPSYDFACSKNSAQAIKELQMSLHLKA